MNTVQNTPPPPASNYSPEDIKKWIVKWTPRALAAALGGYYALGVAYECGIMAAIDQIAIRYLKHYVGYVGIGAAMPTFQWYAAWGVRATAALGAGLTYDVCERVFLFVYRKMQKQPQPLALHFYGCKKC